MSFEPTDAEAPRPTTEIQPLVPVQPGTTPSTRDGTTPGAPSETETDRPPRTEYATPYTRHREEILPGVAQGRRD
jgi:hypothetical protein